MNVDKIQNLNKSVSLKPQQKQHLKFAQNTTDRVSFHSHPIETGKVLTKIIGSFSKENFVDVEKFLHEFKNLTTPELIELKNNFIKQNLVKLKTTGMQFKIIDDKEFCEYDNQLILPALKNELKQNSLKIFALNKLIISDKLFSINVPPLAMSIFEHPADKALRITGDFTRDDIIQIQKKEKEYSTLDINNLYENKTLLLDRIKKYCKKNNLCEKDFISIKNLVIEYTALNNVQKQKGVFTKDLERVLNASQIPTDIKGGNFIEGLGLVTNRLIVDNNDSIIVHSHINKSHMLKMYNLQKLNCRPLDKGFNLNTMNEFAKILIQNESKSYMAQIMLTILSPKDLETITGIKETKQSYYIGDFLNYDKIKYPSAAKIIALRMLKLISDNQLFPVYLKALAYNGSKHSPVNFYRHYGLTPISHTNDEIEKIILQNNGSFPYKTPVFFSLKNFETIKNRFELWKKIFSM